MQSMTLYRLAEARYILRTWKSRGNSHSQHPCRACRVAPSVLYLVKARMILAEMWRKNMDAMKESERTRTMKGSLQRHFFLASILTESRRKKGRHLHSKPWRVVRVQLEHGVGRAPRACSPRRVGLGNLRRTCASAVKLTCVRESVRGKRRRGGVSRKETHRICAPGGFATAPAADVEREETEREGASESD
jgi:hypothetical protein